MVGYSLQGISLVLTAILLRVGELQSDPAKTAQFGAASSSMVYIFLIIFSTFTMVPCWIYPTEIWPQEIRARGFAYTILGW